jgi:hypothetical protein
VYTLFTPFSSVSLSPFKTGIVVVSLINTSPVEQPETREKEGEEGRTLVDSQAPRCAV